MRASALAKALTVAAAAAAITGVASAAHASPQATAIAHQIARTSTATTSMSLIPVSKVTGRTPGRPGYVTLRLKNGKTISVQAKYKRLVQRRAAADAKKVTPYTNPVYGNCGYSYIYTNYKSNGEPVHMDTGFEVYDAAIEYAWHAHIAGSSGTGYSYNYHASGGLDFDYGWHGQHSSSANYPTGTYAASVYSDGTSWALLDTGGVCYSGGPYDSSYLYY